MMQVFNLTMNTYSNSIRWSFKSNQNKDKELPFIRKTKEHYFKCKSKHSKDSVFKTFLTLIIKNDPRKGHLESAQSFYIVE
jgi:hypothetical protein